jgi:ABC-type nickel/cobalt efflux system permease component RcnA
MLLLGMIFVAGVLHGLGPDHLAAITAFGAVAGRSFRRVTFFSLRFAAGHAVVIAVAALAGHFGRLALPLEWERGFDLGAAALLILTGIGMLIGLLTGHLAIHSHQHHHDAGEHRHLHAHLGGKAHHQHRHGRLAFTLGGLFALGGARSLLVIVPAAIAATFGQSVLRIGAFTLGIVIAMSAYGLLAGSVLERAAQNAGAHRQRWFLRLATGGVSLFCIVAGLLTLSERLRW